MVIVAMAAVSAALLSWWRQRGDPAVSIDPPEWPAFIPPEPGENGSPMSSWVIGADAETAPDGFPIKVKVSSGIFHVPGGRFYDRTKPDRWYATEEAAIADGYRRSKT